MSGVTSISIDFTVGSRCLFAVDRRLATWSFALKDVLAADAALVPPEPGPDGLRVLSTPSRSIAAILAQFPQHLIGGRQDYQRHYIDMTGSYDDYLARFSGKTRSTLRRKARKLAKEVGDAYHLTEHRTPVEIEHFLDAAIPLSAKTYQARLLDAGLPDMPQARKAMLQIAENDQMRGFLLHGLSLYPFPTARLPTPISATIPIGHACRPAQFCKWKHLNDCLPRDAMPISTSPRAKARTRRCSALTVRTAPASSFSNRPQPTAHCLARALASIQ